MFPLVFVALLPPQPSALWERQRFPDDETANRMLQFNLAFQDHCRLRASSALSLAEREYWQAAQCEAEQLRQCWYCIYFAPHEPRRDDYYREWLNRLRCQIGNAAFAAGQMPPAIPVWRCRVIP